ncbi:hypothetical protein A3F34_02425 [Candidatus Roizmanbacteria bacterium RIFCSPHIGHO2_12_FULL_44_10]|uniref:Aspartyl/glutamyl-tRNA(Asn/Gln) amidotransferase subunit C n=1 Tax=Candidatus Roizmanbacteria bacterium RIFCSPHIGHO2_12_FULL_44_10 TaxID=1802054 RepID=A0A1F7I5W9_9BACT|nr:MAG: hypothetical protein A3F34_02425 [Candidatus Roizmanbacteria bacterium RIFCSPHIGHO2_12_FULL_44_10]
MSSSSKKLSKEDVLHIAKLANLEISEAEVEEYAKQLTDSLQYVANLEEVDTSSVSPDFFTTEAKNVTREDVADNKRMLTQEEALKPSHTKKKGHFVVKRIL